MKKNANEIFMLQYQIKRYQAMGNGTMCQTLNGKLQKLLAKQSLDVYKRQSVRVLNISTPGWVKDDISITGIG